MAYGKKPALWIRIIISIFFFALAGVVLVGGLQLIKITRVYPAEEGVTEFPLLDDIEVTEIQDGWDVRRGSLIAPGGWYFDGPGTDTALIFYPEKCVDAAAYQPMMHKLAEQGIDCFLIKPLLSIPFLYEKTAGYIMDAYSETYTNWYIAGHGQGGETAASFASEHLTELNGLILLGSYSTKSLLYGGFYVLSIYGTNDTVIDADLFVAGRQFMPGNYTEVALEGGNHSYFGYYGLEENDAKGSLTADQQQANTIQEITKFIRSIPKNE